MQDPALIITSDFLSWSYYDTTTMRLLLRLALLSLDSPDGTVSISTRKFADSLSISHKELRTALTHLQQESIISIQPTKSCSIVRIEQWHSLSHCFKTTQGHTEGHTAGTQGAQQGHTSGHTSPAGAHIGHTSPAKGAHIGHTQPAENHPVNPIEGHTSGTPSPQQGHTEGTENIPPAPPSPLMSPEPPVYPTPPIPPSKKKEKMEVFSQKFFDGIMEKFNQAMIGKNVPRCTKMSEERCQAVRNFTADYSVADISTLISKAASSTRLTDGRSGKRITFDLLFNPRYYIGIMEGAWETTSPCSAAESPFTAGSGSAAAEIPASPQFTAGSGSAAAKAAENTPSKSWLEAAAEKSRQRQQQKDREERARLQAIIDGLPTDDNPQRSLSLLRAKSQSGELARLGISWQPPDTLPEKPAENGVTPSDLAYIQSILNRK